MVQWLSSRNILKKQPLNSKNSKRNKKYFFYKAKNKIIVGNKRKKNVKILVILTAITTTKSLNKIKTAKGFFKVALKSH